MRALAAACGLLFVLGVQAAPPAPLDWAALRPPPAAAPDDPFARLADAQLDALRELVRARMLAALGLPVTEAGKAREAELMRQLESQGVAVEPLLAQRDAIIEQRRREGAAGVAALEGKTVELTGYLLAVAGDGRPAADFLFVEIPGSCSHATPPPPNQVLRVRSARPVQLTDAYTPATVHGRLRLRPERVSVFAVDGEVSVASSYAMDDADVRSPR
jgi:hypothetical protein